MNELKGFLWGVLVCAVIGIMAECGGRNTVTRVTSDTVRVVVHDTVEVERPVPVDSMPAGYVVAKLPKVSNSQKIGKDCKKTPNPTETAENILPFPTNDSVDVIIPITQNHYKDSLYEAWVSGYDPKLDSIRLFIPHTSMHINTQTTEMKYEKRKPWSVTVGVGYGLCGNKAEPFVGAMVGYTIFEW